MSLKIGHRVKLTEYFFKFSLKINIIVFLSQFSLKKFVINKNCLSIKNITVNKGSNFRNNYL